ncbi:hypothetical protein [Rhodopirellula sp. MGV]|uniref:hypothetical protein n=1 Tax=Rhodopirellula sp. MGV TaxID=2023130 RepID=UPI000B9709C3|nr:hypothetical protein [Rhodopirellula sp. MGV]OYP31122.1 hypothetical protein CGZ80_21240 [Rhodopirellula sp. MGV]PNY36054.1 hypothetical protein C2E31_15185 [Rhodopirellula baltica]
MYQSSRLSQRRVQLQEAVANRAITLPVADLSWGHTRRWLRTLGLTVGFLGGLAMPTAMGDTPCDSYQPSCDAGLCDCGMFATTGACDEAGCDGLPHRKPHNPLFATLDAVAGGIEKTLGLDKCKTKCNCQHSVSGCGCSHHTVEMLPSVPVSPAPLSGRTLPLSNGGTLKPLHQAKPVPSTPSHEVAPSLPAVPKMQSTPPRIIETPAETAPMPTAPPSLPKPQAVEPTTPAIPEPTPVPEPAPKPDPIPAPMDQAPVEQTPTTPDLFPSDADAMPPENEAFSPLDEAPKSPFGDDPQPLPPEDDGLNDIFGMPEEAPKPTPQPKTPTQPEKSPFDILDEELNGLDDPFKEDSVNLRRNYPAILPAGARASSYRRSMQVQPIGSGLRPVSAPAALQPVSHEEPMQRLAPLGGGGKLAPYRARR